MRFVTDKKYDIAPKTKCFTISGNRFISFIKIFKYLESLISYDLDDTYDIGSRIKKKSRHGYPTFLFDIKCRPSCQMPDIYGCTYKSPPLRM